MGNKLYEENDIQSIANAIRSKGISGTMKVSQMASKVLEIPTGRDDFKQWVVTTTSDSPGSAPVDFMRDDWIIDHFNDFDLTITIKPLNSYPLTTACTLGGTCCNTPMFTAVDGDTSKISYGYRIYRAASPSAAAVSFTSVASNALNKNANENARPYIIKDGTIRIGCAGTGYVVPANTYLITAYHAASAVDFGESLPSCFQKVEYITSDRNAWIDTGIIPTLDYTVEVTAIKEIGYSLFGSGSQDFTFTGGSSYNYAYIGNTRVNMPAGAVDNSTQHVWCITNRRMKVDSTLYAASSGTKQPVYPIALFARRVSDTSSNDKGLHTVYGAKIYDENNVLLADLVPCYLKYVGTIGMYDRVRKKFLVNASTSGSFTKGPDIT